MLRFVLTILAATLAGPAWASDAKRDDIRAMKDFAESLGLKRTGNFEKATDKEAAAYRCYYTGKLELPPSYDELRFEKGSKNGCDIDRNKYDVFFYPIQAVASGSAPVTASLAESQPERLLMVVSHEDAHQFESEDLSSSVTEAASTLMGFITAAEFARVRSGDQSDIYRKLAGEVDLFLKKALIVNAYYPQLATLYESVRSGSVDKDAALQQKHRLFSELHAACKQIPGTPATFNKCPAEMNNAGLAFDYTYTKHYPLLHRLFVSRNRAVRPTLEEVQKVLGTRLKSEEQFVSAITAALRSGSSSGE